MSLLDWAQKIQAIAQTGLAYCEGPYDRERYQQLLPIAYEMLAAGSGTSVGVVEQAFALEKGYPTPKVDVRAAVFRDGRLLLVREKSSGKWTLPGGWADVGDTASEVAARETREEAGFDVRPVKLLAVLDKARHAHPPSVFYTYKLFFRCELQGGEARASHETLAAEFFDRAQLPPLDTDRTTGAQVERMFAHFDRPDLPTEFD